MANILWLDNDPGNIESLVNALRARGHEVQVCRTVTAAERSLRDSIFELLILDVMIPVTEDELITYPYDATGDTLATGLRFYERFGDQLGEVGTAVLVMTVRVDEAIALAFREAGLSARDFATRYELRDTRRFLARIDEVLSQRNERKALAQP